MAPPSVHPSGAVYQWLDLDEVPILPSLTVAPEWLLALVAAPTPGTGQAQHGKFTLPARIKKGVQHHTLFKYASSLRAKAVAEDEILARVLKASRTCEDVPPEANVRRIVSWVVGHYAAGSQRTASIPDPGDECHELEDDGSGITKRKPNALAQEILQDHRIINVDGFLYEYGLTHWQQISTERLKSLAAEVDGNAWTSQRRRAETADFIRSTTYRRSQQWRLLQPWEIAVGNGVVDLRDDRLTLRSHRAEDYLQACVPVPLQARADASTLMRCLDTYFGRDDDGEAKTLALQEFFGYCLMSHARYKKALLCYGESNCGKSTIPFLLRELVGGENMCAVSVEDMDDPRKRAPLRGKLINALTELPTDAMIADGGFKTLVSTEEPIQFDEKYMPSIMDIPIAKHVIVTNVLPTVNDRSRGTFNRLLLIHFNHVIPESEQDKTVWDKLRSEIEGVLLWALEGAQRLYQRDGRFTKVGAVEMAAYISSQNPLVAFLNEKADISDPDYPGVFLHELREAFERWYGQRVRPQYLSSLLRSAGYVVGEKKERRGDVRGFRVVGIQL